MTMVATADPSPLMDADWREKLPLLQQTGFFTEEELRAPDAVKLKLTDLVRRHTTAVVYSVDNEGAQKVFGSGTFLRKANGEYGILTAGHVLKDLRRARECGNSLWAFPPGQRVECEWDNVSGYGYFNSGPGGPDIAWVPLSPAIARDLEARPNVVFYEMGRKRGAAQGESLFQIGIVMGLVHETSDTENRTLNFHAMLLGQTRAWSNGWDYGEYALTMGQLPCSHAGVSGSAVWRIVLGMGKAKAFLDGVVFAEGPADDRKLVAHGKRSVSRILSEA